MLNNISELYDTPLFVSMFVLIFIIFPTEIHLYLSQYFFPNPSYLSETYFKLVKN